MPLTNVLPLTCAMPLVIARQVLFCTFAEHCKRWLKKYFEQGEFAGRNFFVGFVVDVESIVE